MRNQLIRDRYAALTILGQRHLPSTPAVNKVTMLLSRFEPAYLATERARKKIIADHKLPDDHDGAALPLALNETRTRAIDALMDEGQPIRLIPERMRLTFDDLPRSMKGDDGWKNAEGVAHLANALGSLYVRSTEQLALDTPSAELEPDETAPSPPTDPMAAEE